MKKIYCCRYNAEAGMIKSLLNAEGFHALDTSPVDHVSFAGSDIWHYVQVPETEYESAKSFLVQNNFKDVL
jgi:hypothetical protein